MQTGLFFGSFNPIHTGHLIIANQFVEFTDLEEIWFVVSPQNPLKEQETLMEANLRLKMVNTAIAGNNKFKSCAVEFDLPKPSYTINTLYQLAENYPERDFIIIMGSDAFIEMPQWKDYKSIQENYAIYVYKRPGYKHITIEGQQNIFDFPYLDISATYIRHCLQKRKSLKYLVPDEILTYLS